jgi:hypothetical protein
MRYQMQHALVAATILAMASTGNSVLATPPGGGPSVTLAQAQQPATPAPAAGVQQQPSGTSTTMPGQTMVPGQGMGEMGKGMGPMMGGQGHPGPMGGMPSCPPGQTASGTPPTCK